MLSLVSTLCHRFTSDLLTASFSSLLLFDGLIPLVCVYSAEVKQVHMLCVSWRVGLGGYSDAAQQLLFICCKLTIEHFPFQNEMLLVDFCSPDHINSVV